MEILFRLFVQDSDLFEWVNYDNHSPQNNPLVDYMCHHFQNRIKLMREPSTTSIQMIEELQRGRRNVARLLEEPNENTPHNFFRQFFNMNTFSRALVNIDGDWFKPILGHQTVQKQLNGVQQENRSLRYLFLSSGAPTNCITWPEELVLHNRNFKKSAVIYHGNYHFVGVVRWFTGFLHFNTLKPCDTYFSKDITCQPAKQGTGHYQNTQFVIYADLSSNIFVSQYLKRPLLFNAPCVVTESNTNAPHTEVPLHLRSQSNINLPTVVCQPSVYRCKYLSCSQQFSTIALLERHYSEEHGLVCFICHQKFSTQHLKVLHDRKHFLSKTCVSFPIGKGGQFLSVFLEMLYHMNGRYSMFYKKVPNRLKRLQKLFHLRTQYLYDTNVSVQNYILVLRQIEHAIHDDLCNAYAEENFFRHQYPYNIIAKTCKFYYLNKWMLVITIQAQPDIELALNIKGTKLNDVTYIFIQDRAWYEKKVLPTTLSVSSLELTQIGQICYDGDQWIGNINRGTSIYSFGAKNYRTINRISNKYEPNTTSYIHFIVYIVNKQPGMFQ